MSIRTSAFHHLKYRLARLLVISCMFLCSSVCFSQHDSSTSSVVGGELLTYNVYYGWFKVGKAELWLDPEIHADNGACHYLVQCRMKTQGWFKLLASLDVCMETQVDTLDFRPIRSIWTIDKAKKSEAREELYVYGTDSVKVEIFEEHKERRSEKKFPRGRHPTRDALANYMWLRSLDDDVLSNGEQVKAFFSKKVYDFSLEPEGTLSYSFEGEKKEGKKFKLIFPVSTAFPKGKEGYVIVSNDSSRVPYRFTVDMNLGSFSFKLDKRELPK